MKNQWPLCVRCGHSGPHVVKPVANIHEYVLECGRCHRYLKWLGKRGKQVVQQAG